MTSTRAHQALILVLERTLQFRIFKLSVELPHKRRSELGISFRSCARLVVQTEQGQVDVDVDGGGRGGLGRGRSGNCRR